MRILLRNIVAPLALTLSLTGAALAGSYPEKPITVIVPYSAGAATDLAFRQIQPRLSEILGQQIVVENKGGASGISGTQSAAKATADGYTLLVGSLQTHGINPALYKSLPYDPVKDFTAISRVDVSPLLLAASSSLGVDNIEDLVELAKQKPDALSFGSSGSGTSNHLAGELFNAIAGTRIVHVPYTNVPQGLTDLMSGSIAMMFYAYLPLRPAIESGKVNILLTTAGERVPFLPDVPTSAEAGMGELDLTAWTGIYAPAGTPQEVVDIVYAAVEEAMKDEALLALMAASGSAAAVLPPAEFAEFTKVESERYKPLVESSGAQVQ